MYSACKDSALEKAVSPIRLHDILVLAFCVTFTLWCYAVYNSIYTAKRYLIKATGGSFKRGV
jgi:hypothetical protein